ncbi:MAG TPA: hypothetical protein VLM79_14160 [Kofleriaceae bacterium]|nr:hypothetical protein [Kofleriaceae bacterium]
MTAGKQVLDEVRSEVRALLESSPAFRALSTSDQRTFANSMVRVGSFLSHDPGWVEQAPAAAPLAATALDAAPQPGGEKRDAVEDLKGRLADKPKLVGEEFKAGAVREGVEQFGEMVKKVDFPAFVSGLVNGVFKAVVDASIEQMRAYGELLAACSKTVDEFARDNISDAMARDHVRGEFPASVTIDTAGDSSRLKLLPDADGNDLARRYGVSNVDLDDPEAETKLLASAKLELGRQRQQLLCTMVLLGINRIVVTDGRINAKVVFDMRADDSARRRAKAQLSDEQKSASSAGAAAATWGPWGGAGGYANSSQSHVATVESSVDDTSQARAEVKAQLTGEVQLRFKSDVFPLDKMVDAGGLATLNARSQPPPLPGQQPAPVPAPAPAPGVSK